MTSLDADRDLRTTISLAVLCRQGLPLDPRIDVIMYLVLRLPMLLPPQCTHFVTGTYAEHLQTLAAGSVCCNFPCGLGASTAYSQHWNFSIPGHLAVPALNLGMSSVLLGLVILQNGFLLWGILPYATVCMTMDSVLPLATGYYLEVFLGRGVP